MADPGLYLRIEAALLAGPASLSGLRLYILHELNPLFPTVKSLKMREFSLIFQALAASVGVLIPSRAESSGKRELLSHWSVDRHLWGTPAAPWRSSWPRTDWSRDVPVTAGC